MIKKTNDILEILDLIKEVADENTLILFDVNKVLIITADMSLRNGSMGDAIDRYYLGDNEKYSENIDKLSGLICLQAHSIPLDDNMQEIIRYLDENKIRSFALTKSPYGEIQYSNEFKTWSEWKYESLKKIGIDFEKLSLLNKDSKEVLLQDGDVKLYKGIIFTDSNPKGTALNAVLDRLSYTPSKVIFVDDGERNIKSVQTFCNEKEIEFYGFHYTKALESEYENSTLREDFQAKTFIEIGVWLSDDAADELMVEYL